MKRQDEYAKSKPATMDLPFGGFKNESQPGARDGTDIKAEHMQDIQYALYQVLQLAGIVPNGELEDGKNKRQFLQSLVNAGVMKYAQGISYGASVLVWNIVGEVLTIYKSAKAENSDDISNEDAWVKIVSIDKNNKINFHVNTNISPSGSNLTVFCFNSGLVDTEGKAACVTVANNTLTLAAGSVCTSAGGTTYTVPENISIDISSLTAGTHNFAYDAKNQTIEEYSKVVISSTQPEDFSAGDIWLDNSVMPYSSKMKNSSGEIVAREIIPIPAKLEGIILISDKYNNNPFSDANTDLSNLSAAGEAILNSKLNQNQISNCILEIPERINYEINSAGRIILKAGSEVYISTNGTFEAVTLSSDTAEGAGGLWTTAHNRSLFVVYVPDTNSVQAHALDYTYAQATAPTTFLTGYALWYNTDTKVIKATIDSGANWQICSLPIMIGRPGESNIGWRGYVDNVFNGMGFINALTFVLPGVRALFADKRNSAGTLKSKEVVNNIVNIQNHSNKSSKLGFLGVSSSGIYLGSYGVTNYFEQETIPSGFGQHAIWYNTRENIVYSTSDSGATWNIVYHIMLNKLLKTQSGDFTAMDMPYAVKLVGQDSPAFTGTPTAPTPIPSTNNTQLATTAFVKNVLSSSGNGFATYSKGNTGYIKFANGIIIQWGTIGSGASANPYKLTYPLAFTSVTSYSIQVMDNTNGSGQSHCGANTQTTTGCNIVHSTDAVILWWIAIGY